ncbi:MAG: hypothetical protein GC155_09765 [Alphaproteobacteria bacterium]|nr:hypothetical protein [Alphaproteobacteria bacterium]
MLEDAGDDPFVRAVADLLALDAKRETYVRRWQQLETQLFAIATPLGMDCDEACRSNIFKARVMRKLSRAISDADRELEAQAGRLAAERAGSVAGALAKLKLGIQVQGPYDWRCSALDLLRGGLAELLELTGVEEAGS